MAYAISFLLGGLVGALVEGVSRNRYVRERNAAFVKSWYKDAARMLKAGYTLKLNSSGDDVYYESGK